MKLIIATLMAAAATALAADNATETALKIDREYSPGKVDESEVFRSGEFQLESAAQAATEDFDSYERRLTIGGNYYVTKGAGFHAAVSGKDLTGLLVDRVEFGLVGRVPIEVIRSAILLGVGSDWQSKPDKWSVYAEAGVTFRLNKHLDLFAKIRGVRPVETSEGEHVIPMVGIDIPIN